MTTTSAFQQLCDAPAPELERLLSTSDPPPLSALAAHEYRGWNIPALASLLGIRKFVKGFDPLPPLSPLVGYNSPVKQNRFDEPWIRVAGPDGKPKKYYPFGVRPGGEVADARYRSAIVIDYRLADYGHSINPARFTVDYLVQVQPPSSALLLGKSYLQPPHFQHTPLGFFAIEVFES